WMKAIPDAEDKCQALCSLSEVLTEHKAIVATSVCDALNRELGESWEAVDLGWSKVNTGFKIVALMAKLSPNISRDFLAKTEQVRKQIVLDCRDTAMSYIGCVRLAIRS